MKLLSSITKEFGKAVLKSKHNSPHVFFGMGVAGVGFATYLACKSTLKVESVIEAGKIEVKETKECGERAKISGDSYAEKAYYQDLGMDYVRTAGSLVKLYGPAIIIGGLSIAALTGAHVQLVRRNAALSATLALVSRAYSEYRERVREKYGVEEELDIYRNLETQTIKHPDGTKEVVKVHRNGQRSEYARCFDEQSVHWQRNAELNRMFVQMQQDMANHTLKAQGYIFLNDVYESLGFPKTKAGQIVGWYLNGEGDNYIDFGIHEVHNAEFASGHERSAWLDFNVDGPIHDYLEEV